LNFIEVFALPFLLLLYTYSAIACFYEMGFCFYCTVTRKAACDPGLPHCKDTIPKQIFPEKELRGLSSNVHIHVSVSELDCIFPRSVCLFYCRNICGPKLGLRPRNSFTGHTKMGFSLQCMRNLIHEVQVKYNVRS
jgi:hypothetical protein